MPACMMDHERGLVRERGDSMALDSRQLRNALGTFASGVTVVTSGKAPMFHGMTAQSFSSLSLDPPLVLVCVDKRAGTLQIIKETGAFTVSVLSEAQRETSDYFANKERPAPPEQFRGIDTVLGTTGCPRLVAATTVFDCTLHRAVDAGDHEILIGEVKAFEQQNEEEPILFYKGRYRRLAPAEHL